MSNAANAIRGGIGKVFDVLRSNVFLESGDTLTFLKPSDTANEYTDVLEVSDKWWVEFDDQRKSPKVVIADNSDEITEAMEEATHYKVNDTVYAIDKGSTEPPLGASMLWAVYAERKAQRGQFAELW